VTETVRKTTQTQTTPAAPAKYRQEIAQSDASTEFKMPPKLTIKKKSFSATGVVSRDREALARLLTSF
jgi:hypothetical protein